MRDAVEESRNVTGLLFITCMAIHINYEVA